ncbi:MAG: dephospho-CoA kinase [Myxococcales bacterium]|nr:dephospho-CoA kinase [Myxococcales bacterium]
MTKPVIGLTGGIASGKSAVAAMFGDLGIPVVDADALARDVVAPGTPGLARVVEAFGPEVLAADGTLDRARVGARVFADADDRRRLNAILHPLIAAAGLQRLAALERESDAPYVLYEAALLVETGGAKQFSKLIVVAASESTQLERLMRREGLSHADAQARIDAQLPLEDKIALADHVIWNDGSRDETRGQVDAVHATLVAEATR